MNDNCGKASMEFRGQLEAAAALFVLLGRIFHGIPDRSLFAELVEQQVFEDIPYVAGNDAQNAQRRLLAWARSCDVGFSEKDYHDLRAEYTRLFVGTKRVLAPPWESVYFNKERMVFQHQTFEVRAMYAKHGLEVDLISREPDDHLAYELMFLGHLLARGVGFFEQGESGKMRETLLDAVSFTVCHPLSWVPQWRDTVHRHSSNDFYCGYAALVEAALRQVEDDLSSFLLP